ncbi:MAG: molybdopterin-dependent oxidoreductase, partial [bacterium]|nr:molybdopterin-dependent oxidoreductase [bacterium]
RGTVHAAGPYEIEDVYIESYAVATNTVPCGAFRGFGQPQVNFANESLIDELATKLKMDPYELREKNLFKIGSKTHTGQVLDESCGMREVFAKIKNDYILAKKRKDKGIIDGVGIACNFYGVSLGARGKYLDRAYATVSIENDGSINVYIGNTEIGQGAKTVIAQIAASVLDCPIELIKVNDVNTSNVLDSGPTVASRTTLMSGNAVIDACKKLKKTLDKTGKKDYMEKVLEAYSMKLKLQEVGFYSSPPTSFNFDTDGQGNAYVIYSYTANLCEIKVDRETGEVKVVRFVTAHDFGNVINPTLAHGQIEGGISQAIGYALYENLVMQNGKILNPNFTDYVLQVATQIPEIKTYFVPRNYKKGPFGAKGLAESPIITPAACIRNAIKDATGKSFYKLPILPEDIVDYED